jgi:hypothetical protein
VITDDLFSGPAAYERFMGRWSRELGDGRITPSR